MMKIIYPDTETTGLYPEKGNELVQIAGLIEYDGKVVDEFNFFARPRRLNMIHPSALACQKKTVKDLLAYPPRLEAYKKFTNVLVKHVDPGNWKDKLIWVGQNPSFDEGFVKQFFMENGNPTGFKSFFDPRLHDLKTVAFAAQCAGRIQLENLKQETIARALGIKYDAHDALNDAKCLHECWHRFQAMMGNPVAQQGRLFA